MSALDRIRWALGLVVVFLLLLLNGRSNVHSSKKIQAAIATLYADRLVVKDIIFDLASILHEKELAAATLDRRYYLDDRDVANARARELLGAFRATLLVPLEEQALGRFEAQFDALAAAEAGLDADGEGTLDPTATEPLASRLADLNTELEVLSRIQIDEGRRQLALGDRAVEEMDLVSAIETYLLAAIGILAMGVILFIPRKAPA